MLCVFGWNIEEAVIKKSCSIPPIQKLTPLRQNLTTFLFKNFALRHREHMFPL